jgi:hypothetical protein
MRFMAEVIIDGSLCNYLGAFCFSSVISAPVVSLSMSVVQRGANTLQINTDFGGSFTAADVGTHLVNF